MIMVVREAIGLKTPVLNDFLPLQALTSLSNQLSIFGLSRLGVLMLLDCVKFMFFSNRTALSSKQPEISKHSRD